MEHIEQLGARPRAGRASLPQRACRSLVALSAIFPRKRHDRAAFTETVEALRDYPELVFASDKEILAFTTRHRRIEFYEPEAMIQRRRL